MLKIAEGPDGCDDAPSGAGDPGRLFLWFPVGFALRKVRRYLRQLDRRLGITASGALAVEAPQGYPDDLIADIANLLSEDEVEDTRCVFKSGPGELDADDIQRVRTLGELRRLEGASWLLDLLRAGRLTSVFQPIVHSGETTRVLGHEALVRGIGNDGRPLPAGRLLTTARECGLLPELDCAARRTAISVAARQEERRPLFLNVTPAALHHGARALAPTIAAIESADIPRERVVLEIVKADDAKDARQLRTVVATVRDAGFRVALDDVGCEEHSRRLIHEVRPDFVKLDMERVRHSALPHLGSAERLLDLAQHLNIQTIAESVETGDELDWNRERGATYVQGYFIARPGELVA